MKESTPVSLLSVIFVDDDVYFAKGYLDELDKQYITEIARNIYDAENEISGPVKYACLILDVMMPVPDWWTETEIMDAQNGIKTGIILLRRYKQLIVERNLPVVILTNRQTNEIKSEVEKLGFPTGMVKVLHKLETPSFVLPLIVRDLVHHVRDGAIPHSKEETPCKPDDTDSTGPKKTA